MNRRWAVLTVVAVAAVPFVTSCSSDDDDAPVDPTMTLFEGTRNPSVPTGNTG